MKKTAALILLCAALAAGAEENTSYREWTSVKGDTVTARMTYYGAGTVTLKTNDGRELKIREDALSPSDRTYLALLTDPRSTLDEARVSRIVASGIIASNAAQAVSIESDRKTRDILDKMRATNQRAAAERDAYYDGLLTDQPRVGATGRVENASAVLNQIIDDQTALVTYRYTRHGDRERQVILTGISTSGLADDTPIGMVGEYAVTGTASFTAVNGSKRTVYVIAPVQSSGRQSAAAKSPL